LTLSLRRALLCACALAAVLGRPAAGVAAVLNVPADYPSLTAAVAVADDEDEIRVAAGVYSPSTTGEEFPLVLDGPAVVIRGADPWRCIVDGEATGRLFLIIGGEPELSGLTLTGGRTEAGGGAILVESAGPHLERLRFQGNHAAEGGDAVLLQDANTSLCNCLFVGNGTLGPTVVVLGGRAHLEANTFDRNAGPAVSLHGGGGLVLRSNICSRPGIPAGPSVGLLLAETARAQDVVLDRNLFTFCEEGAVKREGAESDEWLEEIDWAGGPAAPRVGAPLFLDPEAEDYRLRPESPARWEIPYVAHDGTVLTVARELGAYGAPQPFPPPPAARSADEALRGASAAAGEEPGMLEPPVPNPFNPATTIRFNVKEASVVDLGIYNILGQRVRTLFAGELSAGEHTEIWDGRDDLHVDLPPGIYFVRITQRNVTESRRVVLVR
jgi:hypothetical protein